MAVNGNERFHGGLSVLWGKDGWLDIIYVPTCESPDEVGAHKWTLIHTRTSPAGLGAPPGFIPQLVESGSWHLKH